MPHDTRHTSPVSGDRWTSNDEDMTWVSNTGSILYFDPSEEASRTDDLRQKPSVRSSAAAKAHRRAEREERRSAERNAGLRLVTPDAVEDEGAAGATQNRRGLRSENVPAPNRRPPAVREQHLSFVERFVANVTSPRALSALCVLGTTFACVMFAGLLILPSAGELYTEMRENERLASELEQNTARAEWLEERAQLLNTTEGIMDEARRNYGLVEATDHAVTVVGSNVAESYTATAPERAASGTGAVSSTWLTDALDRFFGYTPSSQAASVETATVSDTIASW